VKVIFRYIIPAIVVVAGTLYAFFVMKFTTRDLG